MTTSTHRELAHRAIDYDIDNAIDELHDRALDDYADMLDFDSLRTLAYARHDIECDDMTPTTHDDDDDPAYELIASDEPIPCLKHSIDAIYAICYSYYRD